LIMKVAVENCSTSPFIPRIVTFELIVRTVPEPPLMRPNLLFGFAPKTIVPGPLIVCVPEKFKEPV